jgi:hypothetical protein
VAITVDRDLTVAIGTEDARATCLEALQHFRRRMAEGVAAAGADHGDLRPPGIEQGLRC